jgi:AraC-like DNA-binding protein
MTPKQSFERQTPGYGLGALFDELKHQDVDEKQVLRLAGVSSVAGQLTQPQRLAILKAAMDLATDPLTALKAGQRQRVHYFGVYGFALATSPTLGEALAFGRQHLGLAGAVLRISFRQEDGVGILQSHNPRALGNVLPFAAEFWRSSMVALLSEILEEPFPSTLMHFPYPRPRHGDAYAQAFCCPIEFASDQMEWHFDARVLEKPCPSANSLTANICQDFCEAMIASESAASSLQRELRSFILANSGRRSTSGEVAQSIGLSRRTLFRRLHEEGTSFQKLLNETRASLACEYLGNTRLPVSEIADRCGFGDEANFRKAFHGWCNTTPSQWRSSVLSSQKNRV